MSLWPILQHRRRNDAHDALSRMPEPLQAGASLSAAGSFEHTAEQILRQTLDVTGAGSAVIFRLDPNTERLRSLIVVAGGRVAITPELACAVGEGLAGRAASERRVIWTGNALEDRQAVVQRVGEHVGGGAAPRHQLAVVPDPAVAVRHRKRRRGFLLRHRNGLP